MPDSGDALKASKFKSPSLKARALRLLSLREYSRKDLGSKLSEYASQTDQAEGDTTLTIESILDDFEQRGWLSDTRFAEALVRRRSERYGMRKIQGELNRAGVSSEHSADLLEQLKLSEYARAKELWVRKFDMIATEPKEKARQYRFLVSKGFNADLVARIISGKPNKQ
ncbi:MAG: recombination regulator RecX [Polynucleobacter sp.]|nr:recombination regulator RecX [Polynucleobacter sp.]